MTIIFSKIIITLEYINLQAQNKYQLAAYIQTNKLIPNLNNFIEKMDVKMLLFSKNGFKSPCKRSFSPNRILWDF